MHFTTWSKFRRDSEAATFQKVSDFSGFLNICLQTSHAFVFLFRADKFLHKSAQDTKPHSTAGCYSPPVLSWPGILVHTQNSHPTKPFVVFIYRSESSHRYCSVTKKELLHDVIVLAFAPLRNRWPFVASFNAIVNTILGSLPC